MITEIIILAVLVIGCSYWVTAWLHWMFEGKIRHFFMCFLTPESWRGGYSRSLIKQKSNEDLETFIAISDDIPYMVGKLMNCPLCLSAHLGFVAVLLCLPFMFLALNPICMTLTPLMWAAASYIGFQKYNNG